MLSKRLYTLTRGNLSEFGSRQLAIDDSVQKEGNPQPLAYSLLLKTFTIHYSPFIL